MVRALFVVCLLYSSVSKAVLLSEFWKDFGTYTEYSNEGLIGSVNWPRFLYFGKPDYTLEQIQIRAGESQHNAEDLLLRLTETLSTQQPAGEYIVELYRNLLNQAQQNGVMSQSALDSIVARLRWERVKNSNDFNRLKMDPIEQQIFDFIVTQLNMPISVFGDPNQSQSLQVVAKVLLLAGTQDSIAKLATLESSLDSNDLTAKMEFARTLLIYMGFSKYFDKPIRSPTELGQDVFDLRKKILSTFPPDMAKVAALDGIRSFQITQLTEHEYFQYMKRKPDLQILLGSDDDEEEIKTLSVPIEQMVKLLRRLDRQIPESLASLYELATGNTVEAMSSTEGENTQPTSSTSELIASSVRRAIIPTHDIETSQELIIRLKRMCSSVRFGEVSPLGLSCANDLIGNMIKVSQDQEVQPEVRELVKTSALDIFFLVSAQFNGSQFTAECAEVDPEEVSSSGGQGDDEMNEVGFLTTPSYRGDEIPENIARFCAQKSKKSVNCTMSGTTPVCKKSSSFTVRFGSFNF